jgi:hypothetical protein
MISLDLFTLRTSLSKTKVVHMRFSSTAEFDGVGRVMSNRLTSFEYTEIKERKMSLEDLV